jgi:hypothetical protein
MPPKIKKTIRDSKGRFIKTPEQSYLEKLLNSDYIKNLPYAIAGIVITGLTTKYVIGTDRINPTSAETQIINNLTSNYIIIFIFKLSPIDYYIIRSSIL